jgi:hypothetical protein
MDENELDYDSEMGASAGMYMGDAQATAYDPFASGMKMPESGSFYYGIDESRM